MQLENAKPSAGRSALVSVMLNPFGCQQSLGYVDLLRSWTFGWVWIDLSGTIWLLSVPTTKDIGNHSTCQD